MLCSRRSPAANANVPELPFWSALEKKEAGLCGFCRVRGFVMVQLLD